jgi:hypothetical protein
MKDGKCLPVKKTSVIHEQVFPNGLWFHPHGLAVPRLVDLHRSPARITLNSDR